MNLVMQERGDNDSVPTVTPGSPIGMELFSAKWLSKNE